MRRTKHGMRHFTVQRAYDAHYAAYEAHFAMYDAHCAANGEHSIVQEPQCADFEKFSQN